jgi:hypothetical protein
MVVAGFAPCFGVKTSRENEMIATIRLESDYLCSEFVHLQAILKSLQLLTASFCKARMLKRLESSVTRVTRSAHLRSGRQRRGYNNLDGNLVGPIAGRAAIEAVNHRKTRQKSGPGIEAWFLQRHPTIAEPLRLVRSRPQRRRNAIVDLPHRVLLA